MKTHFKLRICGLNLHRIIAYISENNLHATDLKRIDHKTLELSLSRADYKVLKKFDLYKQYEVKVLEISGAGRFFNMLLSSLGILVGLVIVIESTLVMTSKITSLQFDLDHTCQNEEMCIYKGDNYSRLLEVLAQNGVYNGAKIKNLPTGRELEQVLTKEFEQISAVRFEVVGVKAKISIVEAKLPQQLLSSSLIATKSGIVTKIDVSSGKCNVQLGQIVLEGQTLVESENDVPVSASITLRAFYNDSYLFCENQVSYVPTGRKKTAHILSIFKDKEPTCDFELYEKEIKSSYLFFNYFLPIKVKTITFYELTPQETMVDFSSVEEKIKEELEQKVTSSLPKNAQKQSCSFSIYREGNKVRIDCHVETVLTLKKGHV